MAEVILNCPQCQRSLRVTDDLLGRPVKCPACGITFTVSSGQRTPVAQEPPRDLTDVPVSRREQPPHERQPWELSHDDHDQAKAYVVPAAVCLLVVGLLAFAFDAGQVVFMALVSDASLNKLPKWALNDVPLDEVRAQGTIIGASGAAMAALIVIASIQMLRLRMYPLAIVGSVLAMLNCVNACCILGLPLGLWSLIVLVRTDVRAAFQ